MRLLALRPDGTFPPESIPNEGGGSIVAGTFYPEDYGAVGDGVTDDTQAWKDCIAAAVAAAPNHNYAVTVQAQAAEYLIAGNTIPGHEYGNAQIPIPHNLGTNPKIVLTIRGASDVAAFLYWNQNAPQSLGTVLKSTLSSASDDPTWGTPSVLGGPTDLSTAPPDTYATYSNYLLVLDGIQIQVPFAANSLMGVDLYFMANAYVKSAAVFADRSLNTVPPIGAPTTITTGGIRMPHTGNNVRNQIDAYTAEGIGVGIYLGEHTEAAFIGLVYCNWGVSIQGTPGPQWPDGTQRYTTHGFHIAHLLVEATNFWLVNQSATAQVIIDLMGGEGVTAFDAHIHDPDNRMVGHVNILDIYQQFLTVNGGANMRIINDQIAPGLRTDAPAVGATGVPIENPYYRDALVSVIGGTVTEIDVNGVDTGQTTGQVFVPSGGSITITHSAAPTWQWLLI
jgi:Tfp pilus assembly protein PilZ